MKFGSKKKFHLYCASVGTMSGKLDELEDYIREKVVSEQWTHKKLSDFFQQTYPGEKGFSVRSLERFCSERDIHKTPRIRSDDLDVAVDDAIKKVCVRIPVRS